MSAKENKRITTDEVKDMRFIHIGDKFKFMPDPDSIGGTYWMQTEYEVIDIKDIFQGDMKCHPYYLENVKLRGITLYGRGAFDFLNKEMEREFWTSAYFLVNSKAFEHYSCYFMHKTDVNGNRILE